MLIRSSTLLDGTRTDVHIVGGAVAAVGEDLPVAPGETVVEAHGAALLPGLHDHHLHLMALAGSLESLRCGPPDVATAAELERLLAERAAQAPGAEADDWIRGVAYHESVAGDIDRRWLDRIVPTRPVRVQHRSGRLWILNSVALDRLGAAAVADSTTVRDRAALASGRLYDSDAWLRAQLGARPPSLRRVGALLAQYGVTGVTDASASNTQLEYALFLAAVARSELRQQLVVMGDASLDAVADTAHVRRGPTKIYLRESALPAIEELCERISRSHAAGRAVAVHCVTEVEVVLAATAIGDAGSRPGDRIEHASVAPPDVVALLAEHGLTVVTQPNFVRERGEAYLADVAVREQPWLYRGRAFLEAGVRLAAGTDAPLGHPNPWLAMQAAVDRRTSGGRTLGETEALSPEQALGLFSGDPLAPGEGCARIAPGSVADLCLLDRPWSEARRNLADIRVVATMQRGSMVWQAPASYRNPFEPVGIQA